LLLIVLLGEKQINTEVAHRAVFVGAGHARETNFKFNFAGGRQIFNAIRGELVEP
jgi:hypothetical protein